MGRLECLSFPGLEAWINSDDQAKKRGMAAKDRKRIAAAVEKSRAALYREWLEKALVKSPGEHE